MAENQVNIVITAVNKAKGAFNDLNSDLKGLQESGKATKAEIAAAGAAIVGTITAIGVTAVTKFADFEASMSKVKAVTNITGQEFVDITELARELGATTVFTAQEVADAMFEMGQAGFSAKEIMAGIPATLDLAAAGGLEIAQATEIASSTLRGFQLTTEETTRVVDIMAATAATSNASIVDFGESMKYFAPSAAAFGVSIEEASAVVGILSNAGIKGSLATRALGTSLARLAKPTKQMSETMDDLSFSAFDAEGNFKGMAGMIESLEKSLEGLTQEQRMATIAQLFGAEAIQEINVLLAAGSDGLQDYTEQLANSEGEARRMAATMLDNLNGAFEQLSGAVDDIFISLGSMLAPTVRIVAEGLTILANALGAVLKWIQTLPAPIQTFLGIFAGLVGLLVTGVAAWAAISFAMSGFIAALSTLAGGILAVTGGFLPLIAIIAGVTAVIAALWYAWDNNLGGIRDLTQQFVAEIVAFVELLQFMWSTNMYGIQDIARAVWGGIKLFIETTMNVLVGILKIAFGLIKGDWTIMWDGIKQVATTVWNFISAGWEAWSVIMQGITNTIADWMRGAWDAIGSAIMNAMSSAWEGVKNMFASGINWIIDKMNAFIRSLSAVTGAVGKAIGQKNWNIPEIPRIGMKYGGILPAFAGSGVLQGARGTDTTPFVGSPGEVILNYAHQAALASALRGRGQGGELHIHVENNEFNGSGEEFARDVADMIWKMASPHVPHEAF